MMQKRKRQLLFYLSIALFLLASPIVVTFALGYTYDFQQFRFVKTGSFRVKVNTDAQFFVNGKASGATSFLANTVSKTRLAPRTYTIRLEKKDYRPWQKQIGITAGVFTDFPRVILVPATLTETVIASSSFIAPSSVSFDRLHRQAVFVSSNRAGKKPGVVLKEIFDLKTGKKVMPDLNQKVEVDSPDEPVLIPPPVATAPSLQGQVTSLKPVVSIGDDKVAWFNGHDIWLTWTKDTAYQPFISRATTKLIISFKEPIVDIQWYRDDEHLIVNVGGILKFIELDTRGGAAMYDLAKIQGPFLYDGDVNLLYLVRGRELISVQMP